MQEIAFYRNSTQLFHMNSIKRKNAYNKILLLALSFIALFVVGCTVKDAFNCEGYKALDTYKGYSKEYQFSFNQEKHTFAVLDTKCKIHKSSEAKEIFENYFTERYAQVVKRSPPQLTSIEEATDVMIKLIEEPLDKITISQVEERKQELVKLLRTNKFVEATYDLNVISGSFNNLYELSSSTLNDEELSTEEMEQIQKKVSLFIYTFLDETNQVKSFGKKLSDSWIVDALLTFDKQLKKTEWYSAWRREKVTQKIELLLFEKPSKLAYNQLNG